jgi:hypothetical protein
MADYRIVKDNEGVEQAYLLAEIHLGPVEQEFEAEGLAQYVSKGYLDTMLEMTKDQIYDLVANSLKPENDDKMFDSETFAALLERYADLSIADRLGVSFLPITRTAEGEVTGFKEGMIAE